MTEYKAPYNMLVMRLSHIPTVTTCGRQFAVWSDIKQMLLWCADPHCSVLLDALNHARILAFIHPCSKQEQIEFATQFVAVRPGTCLVDLEILTDPQVLSYLHNEVRKNHMESGYNNVCRCSRMLRVIMMKYANTSFKIPLRMASNMNLLPALKRNILIYNHDGRKDTTSSDPNFTMSNISQTSIEYINSLTLTLVPVSILAIMYPECIQVLTEATRQHIENISMLYQCTVEEGILLTRFVSSYRGYDSHWSCFTSNSLLISWTEFWNRLDSYTQNKLYPKLSNTGMIIVNCQAVAGSTVQNTYYKTNQTNQPAMVNGDLSQQGQYGINIDNEISTPDPGIVYRPPLLQSADVQQRGKNNIDEQNEDNNPELDQGVQHMENNTREQKSTVNATEAKLENQVIDNETMPNQVFRNERNDNHTCKPVYSFKNGECDKSVESENYIRDINKPTKNVCNKELDDKMTKDMNNSATKKKDIGLVQSKPGSGDTGNIEKEGVGFKPSFSGNEVLSVNKLTLSKMLNPNTGLVQGSDSNGFNDKQKHIFVPVCDNDTKGEFSVTEVSGYDLNSLASEELGQGIQVSITPRRGEIYNKEQCKSMGPTSLFSDSHATKRDKDVERKYLKLPTAYIQDDMPEAIRLDSKAVNFSAKYAPTNDSLSRSKVQDSGIVSSAADTNTDFPQPCDGYKDKDKPRYSNVTYLQLELTTPMLKGIDLDPNVIQESRKFPYKPVRNDQKQQSKGSPITLPPSTLTTDPKSNHAVPVIEGTQINVKSATEKPPIPERTYFCHQNSIVPPLRDPIIRKSANSSEFEGLQGKQPKVVHMADVFDVSTSKKDNECKNSDTFVATGKVIKKFERNTDFNSSEFMKERITMWRDSVEEALHPNKTERLTKSAGVRRSRPICSNRPMSSVNFSPGSKFERENQVISPSMCPTFARGRNLQQQFGKQQSDSEDSFYEPVQQKNNNVEVQNYGSSSSSTPDIYDEYARKRRPKLIKPETIQIKPKPVTKPIPTTLCQPIVRKTPPQPVAPPKPVSQNHHTAGYTYQTAGKSKVQTTIVMKVEDIKPNIKQTYQHSSTTQNNLYHNSKAFDLKHLTSAVPSNINSNTSCSYPACSLNKSIARKIPSAKDGRKAYVPEFCTFERPPTAKSSSTVESNSSVHQNNGLQDIMSKPNNIDKTEMSDLHLVRKGADNERENIDDVTSTLSGSLENRKSQLLENVASFANTYISPRPSESLEDINSIHAILSTNPLQHMEDIGKGVNIGKTRPASNGQNRKENIPESAIYKSLVHEEDDNNDQLLSKVDSQLYYKVPEDDTYHRVTGNMIIPPDAQFFMHSRGTSEKFLSAVNSFDTLAAESNTEYFNNPSGNETIDSYDGSNVSSSKKTDGIGEAAMEENDHESIFDKILMTSTEFKDKVEQMKHIILETEQAIRKANEQDNDDDEEETNSVSKENSNVSVMSKKLQDTEKDLHKNNKLDPPKVISQSPRLEMPKKIVGRKKSFKEVVEEKRALKKKTEKELSKKKFWTSAHIVEKNEQASNKIDKDKTKPSEKGKKTSGSNTVCSGKSKTQQDITSSKSACNEVSGKKKDDNQITAKKKGSTISQRPKNSEMKAAIGPKPKTSEPKSTTGPRPKTSEQKAPYKERPLRGSTSLTNSDQSKIKLSTNSITAQNNPIKTTANCNVRKQRASKSARQFPRSYAQSGKKSESTDDCTNKILTALRRMSIEKPTKETQIKESSKLDARQRKLRHCVVKGISGEKSFLANKADIEKEKPVKTVEIDSNLINQENVEETLDTSTSQIIHTHAEKQALLDNSTNDCFVSLVRINENTFAQKKHSPNAALSYQKEENSSIGKSNSRSSTLQVDQNTEEEINKNTEDQIDQNIEETTSGHELDERTFITKFNVSELNRHNGYESYENTNFVSNETVGNSDSEWINEVPESGDLIDANVNCPVNETGIMIASSSTHTKSPVQIYLNATEEQYALPDNGCIYNYSPADKGLEASQVKVEMPDAADVVKHEQVVCWGTHYTPEQYISNNDNERRIEHGPHYYDKTEEPNMLYYATEYPDHSDYHRHYGWIPKQECDNDMYASHGHYTCLDNEYYHNEGRNGRLLSKHLENVNTGLSNSENEVRNGEPNQKYLGLRLAWNDSEIVRDRKEELIIETECGKEVYIDVDEPCLQTMSHSENATTDEIVHNDVFLSAHDEPIVGVIHAQDMLKEDEDIEVAKCTTEGDTDQVETERSECKNDVLNRRRDILWSEFDKDKRSPSVSSTQYTGDTSIYSGNLSPSQSEMNVYFEKVSERAGLNPFLENCLDHVPKMSTNKLSEKSDHQVVAKEDKNFLENRTRKNCTKADFKEDSEYDKGNQFFDKNEEDSYDVIQHKKDAQQLPNVNVKDEIDVSQLKNKCHQPPDENVKDSVGGRSDEDNESVAISSTDDDLDDYDDDKSDDADKDYDPGVDSCSDSDDDNDSVVDGENEGTKCKTVKSVNKMKKRNKKKDQEKNSRNKQKGNDFVNESWTKFLKDTYASDNKDENVKKILKKKRKQKDDKQTKFESSIVRDYCLKHVDSEESLAQLKSKLLKQKYLANELTSKVDKKHKDQVKKSKSETCNKKASKLNKKSKSRKSKQSAEDDANDSDEERRKEKEEIKAAEGFIKTQKLYFNILKKMSMDGCKPSKEIEEESTASSPKVEDLPEVLEAVAVHGERIITKAESEAEKALEGTGSLDNILTEDEGTIIEDLTNQCRYQMIEDEDHIQLGGIAFFKAFQLPFVYINGYKYTPVKDAVGMFQPKCCPKKCAIPRNVITKYKTLVKSFSTWEQVYKLDLIKLKKGPTVKTGDMLVKLDSMLSLLPDIVNTIIQQHKHTKLKNSQSCLMNEYKNLLISFKE